MEEKSHSQRGARLVYWRTMKHQWLAAGFLVLILALAGCQSAEKNKLKELKALLSGSGLSSDAAAAVSRKIDGSKDRFLLLIDAVTAEMREDPYLLRRADKRKSLPPDYEPADLLSLDGMELSLSRTGHRLRKPVLDTLLRMSKAAAGEGVSLLVSSTYRSYEYQKNLFTRNVVEMGEKEASRVSAAPGTSQHQLGTAIDFGSITDAFAETKAGRWLERNAGRFGFSLSYPKGKEELTGYVWESWHYRFIGLTAVALQDEFFDGIQHNLMLFLDALYLSKVSP